jgi:hypothetical protein
MFDQADPESGRAIEDDTLPFMLPPDAPEATLLLLVISACLTIILHAASLTHFFGVIILLLTAELHSMTFNPQALDFVAHVCCLRDQTQDCRQIVEDQLKNGSGKILAFISGVGPEEKVLDIHTGTLTEAGHQFQYRAGIIGGLAAFLLIYNFACAVYARTYSTAKISASKAELEVKPARCESVLQAEDSAITTKSSAEASKQSNPLIIFEDITEDISTKDHKNPLKTPELDGSEKSACCKACEALETAQADWVEAVKQYSEASETILEENSVLKQQVMKLEQQICGLREEGKRQDDRIEYLDVLLEEAGKLLGHEANT